MHNDISEKEWEPFSALICKFAPYKHGSHSETEFKQAISEYLTAFLEVNKNINLSSIRDFSEALIKHIYDSLLILDLDPRGKLVDWGSGGGFPGIPILLWRKHISDDPSPIILLDSVKKKMDAVEKIIKISQIDVNFEISNLRGEAFIDKNKVDGVLMRAVAPPEKSIKWLSSKASRWYFYVGGPGLEAWKSLAGELSKRGLSISRTVGANLPESGAERHIILISSKKML